MFFGKKLGKDTEIIECPICGRLCSIVVHVPKGCSYYSQFIENGNRSRRDEAFFSSYQTIY